MNRDQLARWYAIAYDEDVDEDDFWLTLGYESAIKWHGAVYYDAFDALNNPECCNRLNGRADAIRRFVRAYNKGVEDRKPDSQNKVIRTTDAESPIKPANTSVQIKLNVAPIDADELKQQIIDRVQAAFDRIIEDFKNSGAPR